MAQEFLATSGGNIYPDENTDYDQSEAFRRLALNRDVLDAAHKADMEAKVEAANWVKPAIPQDSNLNTYVNPGSYGVLTSFVAQTLLNAPLASGGALGRAILEVYAGGNGNIVQEWIRTPNAPLFGPVVQRQRDDLGVWSAWRRTDSFMENMAISSGDVRLLGPGVYTVSTTVAANAIANKPSIPGAIGAATVEVFQDLISGHKTIRWSSRQAASSTSSIVVQCQQDTAGVWSAWRRTDSFMENMAISNLDIRSLQPGIYSVGSSLTAKSIEHSPTNPSAKGAAIVEVFKDLISGHKMIRWSSRQPSGSSSVHQCQQDTAGVWSAWRRTDNGGSTSAGPSADAAWRTSRGVLRALRQASPGPTPAWAWSAPKGEQISTPTHDGSGQAAHPSVLHVPGGVGGYEYWMAMTPYPYSNEAHEDPNILASHDGDTWVVPAGLTNPLDDAPGVPDYHNSDTHLTLGSSGELVCSWRTVDRPNGDRNIIYGRTSMDGVTWTPKRTIFIFPVTGTGKTSVSQSLVWMGDKWRMYVITVAGGANVLSYYESSATLPGSGDWGLRVDCGVTPSSLPERSWWHVDVQHHEGGWLGIVSDGARGTAGTTGDIYFMRSGDGVAWDISTVPLAQSVTDTHDNMYKTGFVPSGSGGELKLDIFYSAYDSSTLEWHVNRTLAESV